MRRRDVVDGDAAVAVPIAPVARPRRTSAAPLRPGRRWVVACWPWIAVGCGVLATVALHAQGAEQAFVASDASLDDVPQLIEQLGADDYAARRRAEELLIQFGPDAFDALKRAEDDPDLEVAARIRHILHEIRVAWVRRGDGAEVRQALQRFDELSDDERLARVAQLAQAPGGLAALCRVARFDHSPLVARVAALQAIRLPAPESPDAVLAELGASDRLPVRWIRVHLATSEDLAATAAQWGELADLERVKYREGAETTERRFVVELLQRQLGVLVPRGDAPAMLEVVGQWVRLDADAPPDEQVAAALFEILDWLIEQRHWALLEPLEVEYRDAFAKYRVLMYLAAEGYRQQGDAAEAERRGELAYALQSPDDEQRVRIAEQLAVLGEVEWAMREYRYVIERFPVLHEQSLLARSELAVWLHDRGAYQEAAEAMGEFMDALERAQTPPNPADDPDRQAERQRLRADRERLMESLGGAGRSREQLQAFAARRQFYVACWHESEGRFDDQLKHLKLAIAANEQDADVLIALFRCPAADEQTQADTRERIARVSRFWLSLIEDYPDVAYLHNQWAWLIANTEGDFDLAIKFSKRSLQLRPDEASYLDTLGRCYYAAGQLEQAVETQRKAVELQPQMQVMRRQLQFFQDELAKRKS